MPQGRFSGREGGPSDLSGGGGSPPFMPPGMLPPQPQPPMPAPPPMPSSGGGGMVDAGYGTGSLMNGFQQQGPPQPAGRPPFGPPGPPEPVGGGSRVPPAMEPPQPVGRPPFGPPGPPQPVGKGGAMMGQQNKMTVHNPTGLGTMQASQMAAAKRPIPAPMPKKKVGMEPPKVQSAGVGKK